ncbi:MAG TPA: putative Ig domain-containing protein, partial [Solirubrobacterales bacterium]|nr:putative Ig domain-containing protein [Solirubrobacterales bacterium]
KVSGSAEASAAPPGESQTYSVELLAQSLAGQKTQTLQIKVTNPGTAPSFTSASSTTFTVGVAKTFTVSTSSNPVAAITRTGALPSGLAFTANGDGTATISGTAAAASAPPAGNQDYPLTLEASALSGSASQPFTLKVVNPGTPASFTSANSTTFTVGVAKTFTIQTTANPTASLSRTGSLPPGLSFTDNGDGTAKITGTATNAAAPPAASQDYALSLEAASAAGNTTQSFTLKVTNPGTPPSFTSVASTGFTTNVAGSFKVTTTGAPNAALTASGVSLPEWLSVTDNGDGSATLTGTPPSSAAPASSSKNYGFTIKAKSGAGETTQSFTLTVTNPGNGPAITSSTSIGFTTNVADSFKVTTTGSPTPTVSLTGQLPSGVTFTANADGTGTIAGTPSNAAAPPASSQNYPVTISAVNGAGKATQTFTLTVTNPGTAPAITSAAATSFTTSVAGSFEVTSTGAPNAALTLVGTELPSWLKLTDHGNGSATLAGTPPTSAAPAASSKNYGFTIKAKSGAGEITQSFTLTVANPGVKPAITSANSASFTTGAAGTFTVTSTGSPTAALARIEGELPEGLKFADKGDGTATISGTPDPSAAPAASSQPYAVTIKATNGAGSVTQALTLTVTNPGVKPQITTGTSASFTTGTAGSFKVVTSGDPTATLTQTGELPSGVSFDDKGNGTAMLAGTPAASTAPAGGSKPYPITIKAANGAGTASQSFTLTVVNPGTGPSITSVAAATFSTGVAASFEVTSTGNPTPTLSATGTLPAGVEFAAKGNGSATISGTPSAAAAPPGESRDYTFTIKASGVGNVSQSFTLTVVNPGVKPAITSDSAVSFTTGVAKSFEVTTVGDPLPALSKAGGLPDGLSFTNNGDGTATIAGTAPESAASPGHSQDYALTLKAKSAAGEETQPLTLTVVNPGVKPSFSSGSAVSFTTGVEKEFTVSTSGNPVAALAKAGNLPSGITFTANGDGTATIAGTASASAAPAGTSQAYPLTIEASSAAGNASQSFTLTVVNPEVPTGEGGEPEPEPQPKPQPTPINPPTNPPVTPEQQVRVSLSQGKVVLPVGRFARRIVQVTAPIQAAVTCKGKLPKGVRCRVVAPAKVVIEGSKAVKQSGTFKLTIHVADADGTVRRPLLVQISAPRPS